MIKLTLKTSLIFTTFLIFFIVIFSSPTWAKGTPVTNQDSLPGQTVIKNEDGVMYLTTEVNPGQQVSQRRQLSLSKRPFSVGAITLPTGFASNVEQLISSILRAIMVIVALLVFYSLIRGGIDWITSGGDKGKIEGARDKLVAAVVGVVIVAASWAVLLLVLNFLGFESLESVFEGLEPISGPDPATSSASLEVLNSTPSATDAASSN